MNSRPRVHAPDAVARHRDPRDVRADEQEIRTGGHEITRFIRRGHFIHESLLRGERPRLPKHRVAKVQRHDAPVVSALDEPPGEQPAAARGVDHALARRERQEIRLSEPELFVGPRESRAGERVPPAAFVRERHLRGLERAGSEVGGRGDEAAELGREERAREVPQGDGLGRSGVGRGADGEVPDAVRLAVPEAVAWAVSGVVEGLEGHGARQRGPRYGSGGDGLGRGGRRGALGHVVEHSVGLDLDSLRHDTGPRAPVGRRLAVTTGRRDARGGGRERHGDCRRRHRC